MSETELIERLKELKEEGAILGEDEVKILLNLIENSVSKDKIREYKQKFEKDNKTEKVFMTQSSQINASLISFCDELLERK